MNSALNKLNYQDETLKNISTSRIYEYADPGKIFKNTGHLSQIIFSV
jgi:hypothetical protein